MEIRSKVITATIAILGALTCFVAPTYADKPFRVKVEDGVSPVRVVGTIVVRISPKQGYKPNDKYPNKIRRLTADPKKVDLPSNYARGSVVNNTIEFQIPVIPTKKGKHKVTGQIGFSVCNDKMCLTEKIPLKSFITGK